MLCSFVRQFITNAPITQYDLVCFAQKHTSVLRNTDFSTSENTLLEFEHAAAVAVLGATTIRVREPGYDLAIFLKMRVAQSELLGYTVSESLLVVVNELITVAILQWHQIYHCKLPVLLCG